MGMNLLRVFLRLQKSPRIPSNEVIITSTVSRHFFHNSACTLSQISRCEKIFPNDTKAVHNRFSSTNFSDINKSDGERQDGKKKKKTIEVPKIYLISETQAISVVTIEEAKKIAHKKNLHLTPIDNSHGKFKTDKKVYKLISNTQFAEEDWTKPKVAGLDSENKSKTKEIKTLILKSNISEHDALSKIKNLKKWIVKGHSAKVFIGQAAGKGNSELIFKLVEENLKDEARILQKMNKGSEIRFQVAPLTLQIIGTTPNNDTKKKYDEGSDESDSDSK